LIVHELEIVLAGIGIRDDISRRSTVVGKNQLARSLLRDVDAIGAVRRCGPADGLSTAVKLDRCFGQR